MSVSDFPTAAVSPRGTNGAGDDHRTVVSLRGEHDAFTSPALLATMTYAIGLEDADLVVDLSGVEFMDAATIGVIVRARKALEARSRSLTVRAPTPLAQRIFEVCELAFLIEANRASSNGSIVEAHS